MLTFVIEYEAAIYAPRCKVQRIHVIDVLEADDEIDLVENRLQKSLERIIADAVPWDESNKCHIEVTIENVHREDDYEEDFVESVFDRLHSIFKTEFAEEPFDDGDNAF